MNYWGCLLPTSATAHLLDLYSMGKHKDFKSAFEFGKSQNEIQKKCMQDYYCIIVGFGSSAERRYIPKSKKGHKNEH